MSHAAAFGPRFRKIFRRGGLAVLLAGMAAPALAQNTQPTAPPTTTHESPQALVDALHAAFGVHHARAVHAKGILLEGSFTPDPGARALSKAPIFAGPTLKVLARFSDFTGIPDIPDNIGEANPRGFAFKIRTADDAYDVVTHSFNGFPVATSDEFAVFLRAVGASGPDAPHPNAIERFLATHPIAKAFLTSQKPPPQSYATAAYYGVNSFQYTNAAGRSAFVRSRFVPSAGERYLTPAELKTRGPDYLGEELATRLAAGPVSFDWYAQIAEPGDRIEDPSIAWPESRRLVRLGRIVLTRIAADQGDVDKRTLFLPGLSHPGIDPADPMLTLRDSAYPTSFRARQ